MCKQSDQWPFKREEPEAVDVKVTARLEPCKCSVPEAAKVRTENTDQREARLETKKSEKHVESVNDIKSPET
jgi:hypothetical protein